eukprot:9188929-Pyramimonas_sp.AAC.1
MSSDFGLKKSVLPMTATKPLSFSCEIFRSFSTSSISWECSSAGDEAFSKVQDMSVTLVSSHESKSITDIASSSSSWGKEVSNAVRNPP